MTSRHDDDTTPRIERTSVLALPEDELATDDLRRHLVSLAGVRAPTLAPLLRCASVPGGVALTHLVPADAVSMASLSSAGPLRSGQVLGVGVAVLEALVALHALDLVHAGVGPESVLVGPDGSVVLAGSGLGWARTCALDVEPAPAHDIEAVGALVRDLLGPGSAPAPLVVAVVRALDPDLALRPDAVSLLESLRRCGRPESLVDALWVDRDRPVVEAPDGSEVAAAHGDSAAGPRAPDTVSGAPDASRSDQQETGGADDGTSRTLPPHDRLTRDGAPSGDDPSPVSRLRPATVRRPARVSRGARSGSRSRPVLQHPRLFATALGVALLGALVVQHRGAGVDVPPPRSELTAVAAQGGAPTASPAGSPTAAPLASPTAVSPAVQAADGAAAVRRWTSVLAEIDEGRTSSLAVGSTASLREWVTGIAYLADEGLARAVGEADARIEGGGLVVETVIVVRADGTTAVLRVRDRRTAYTVVRDGVRQPVPERAARWWTVTLVLGGSPARWRIAEVADADLSPGGRR